MPAIEVENLHKRYGEKVAVDDVSFTVEKGEIFGILGPNGAGKTTTVESIVGLRQPDRGTIRVLGLDPHSEATELRRCVGVQLQEGQLPDKLKVWEAMDLYASFYRAPADWPDLLERLGLADQRDTPYAKLSGGQKQRLSIALALLGDPQVAVLDELTTGLDPAARRDTWAVIEDVRARGVTILLVTHFMAEAERLCDRLALIGPTAMATYRERKLLRRLTVTPVRPAGLLLAQLLVNLAATLAAAALAFVAGLAVFQVEGPDNVAGFILTFALGAAATFGIGLLLAAVLPNPRVANGVAMTLYFPMLFFAGVWLPGPAMPDTLRRIGEFTPLGAAAEGFHETWAGGWPSPLQLTVMLAFLLVPGALAARLFRYSSG